MATRKAAHFLLRTCAVLADTRLAPPAHSRPSLFGDLMVAGLPACLGVASVGFTLGFFAWYAVVVPTHRGPIAEAGLLAGIALGIVLALTAWTSYSRYFSRRAGITLLRSLRYDALTWLPFLAAVADVRPGAAADARRAPLFVRRHARLRRQGAHRRALQPDGPRGADRLRRHANRHHRHRRAGRRHHRPARRQPRSRVVVRAARRLGAVGRRPLHRHRDAGLPGHRHGVLSALSACSCVTWASSPATT